jgi:hypothetical protein|nr:MAG TPA: hypothetical protein [Caudoviricetes sp.]
MRLYKDTLERSRIDEIIEKFESYGLVHMVDKEEDDDSIFLLIEFTKEILAYDTVNQEYVQTEAWTIHEGEKFEFYPDDRRLIAEF